MKTVNTSSGALLVAESSELIHARGVPYASSSRFQRPQPISTPEERRDATTRGPACPQDRSRLDMVNGPVVEELEQCEECLVLSVTAPVGAASLPVMVWFHGGAYLSGSGEAPKYDPDDLAREGVVVVNVTYRLGVFGYLAPAGFGGDNLGLLDQLTALHWVRGNIAGFGGDPDATTVFGQSAGGDSVLSLLAAPAARGLFQRAIVQSAPLGLRVGGGDLRANRDRMTDAMRTASTQRLQGDPANASTADVLAAQRSAVATAQRFGEASGLAFGPTFGRHPLPSSIEDAFRVTAPDVELLIGFTRDDAAPFVAMNPHISRLHKLGPFGKVVARRVTRHITAKLFGDPTEAVASLWREAGGKAATYRFDWHPAGAPLGACHCIDLPFLFNGDWSDAPMLAGRSVPASLAAYVRDTWAGFARSGIDALNDLTLRFA
jgi:para-nitrobenzyl esterase